jgi:hypothetical protein
MATGEVWSFIRRKPFLAVENSPYWRLAVENHIIRVPGRNPSTRVEKLPKLSNSVEIQIHRKLSACDLAPV